MRHEENYMQFVFEADMVWRKMKAPKKPEISGTALHAVHDGAVRTGRIWFLISIAVVLIVLGLFYTELSQTAKVCLLISTFLFNLFGFFAGLSRETTVLARRLDELPQLWK